jgi:hypothetical protein
MYKYEIFNLVKIRLRKIMTYRVNNTLQMVILYNKFYCQPRWTYITDCKIEIQSDPRTRQYLHSYSFRLIQTTRDSYNYSFFPRTIAQWHLLHVAIAAMHYTRLFPRADPNICSLTTLPHLKTTLVYSFNLNV